MTGKYRTFSFVAAALFALQGCVAGSVALTGAEMASNITSDKTLVDHAASLVTGMDCSSIHSANGYSYCNDSDEENAAAPTYCYRSLGAVTCYDRPDPYGDNATAVE
ncbi:MAG: hypothetical protein HOH66_02625 [Rhodospirillaceae bacterium]|nr:hypothetical protein [Rhodospirillaceae bacterium]MBT6116743.1 hypothetical protein [Rhodospirillaceae bacterium]